MLDGGLASPQAAAAPQAAAPASAAAAKALAEVQKHCRVVALESGSVRDDLPTYAVSGGVMKFDDAPAEVERVDFPAIPGAFVLKNVLTEAECQQLIDATEAMGYTEDAAVSLGRDIRQNENCVWIVDDALNAVPFERCKPHLPVIAGGRQPVGLNARWRFYKYGHGDIFRKHTDGSWPGSGIGADGRLVRDAYGDRWSLFTWLLYLNDDFDGGTTRFYIRDSKAGCIREEDVNARRGSVLCFFHGDHPWSHVHEGSEVSNGTKYVARTDVLYPLYATKDH